MTARFMVDLVPAVLKRMSYLVNRQALARRVESARDKGAQFDALLAYYECNSERIESSPAHRWAIDPYLIDWQKVLSPIEWVLWCEMRDLGAVLYPQYPIGRYFADFANPIARVVVECDGAAWHTNKSADERRQSDIEARGWAVYRITGAACMLDEQVVRDDEGYEIGVTSMAAEFIERIALRHPISCLFMGRHAQEGGMS